jgi:hypothetical protein
MGIWRQHNSVIEHLLLCIVTQKQSSFYQFFFKAGVQRIFIMLRSDVGLSLGLSLEVMNRPGQDLMSLKICRM